MASKIKVTIVEDDFLIGNFIVQSLTGIGYEVTDLCNSYESFAESLQRIEPDIVLFDIKLEGEKTGIDAAGMLRQKSNIPFIFISSMHDKRIIDDAKKLLPSAYLIKPFDEDDLYAAIEVALINHAQRRSQPVKEKPTEESIILPDHVFIKQKQSFIKIAWKEIMYLESLSNYLKFFTEKETYTIRQSIQSLEPNFPPYFFKVHRSFVVNLHFAQQIDPGYLLLPNNTSIPISRQVFSKLMENLRVING
jgi:DNA-binding LytR/AlgR family response regulator